MSKRAEEKEQWVASICDCGFKGGAYLKHYGIMRCECGKFWWALRPERAGPLLAYPWPGQVAVRAEE